MCDKKWSFPVDFFYVDYILSNMFKKFFTRLNNTTKLAIYILRRIVHKEQKISGRLLSVEQQVFFIFANRMIIDAESSLLLSRKGYYGAGYSLVAMMLRNLKMYAALVSDKKLLNDFWNEEANTYQSDSSFQKTFNEATTKKIAQKKFGRDSFNRGEMEKLMHGSCYAIRKYYSQRKMDKNGRSYPLLRMGKFFSKNKKQMINLLIGGILLDFIGIFFTDYEDKKRNEHEKELACYYSLIEKTKLEIAQQEKISRIR